MPARTPPPHRAVPHRTGRPGLEAITIASGHHFPRHSHDGYGIGVVEFGAQRSWSGLGTVEARPGDVIMVNPGEMHDGAPLGSAVRGWRILYLDLATMRAETGDDLPAAIEIVRPVAGDPALAALIRRLFCAWHGGESDPLAIEEGVLRAVMAAALRHGVAAAPEPRASPAVARARARLDAAPERRVTLAELASLAGVSRFQLLRGFAREVGVTPHAYLVQRRVGLARRLLAAGRAPAEAALESGFADQAHLTRAFRRQFGITPGRYRAALG